MSQAVRQILVVEVSPRGPSSASRAVTEKLAARLAISYPDATVIRRDLTADQLPHLNGMTLQAISTKDPEEAARLKSEARLSDALTDELLATDLLVIATPMWNFGIPSALKAWIDHVVRAGRTFQYTPDGVAGLVKDKKAILVLASGAVFTEGPWAAWDFVAPYLTQILRFIGITDVQVVRVEGMNIPPLAPLAIPKAEIAVEELAI